jgi:hypothetical protein
MHEGVSFTRSLKSLQLWIQQECFQVFFFTFSPQVYVDTPKNSWIGKGDDSYYVIQTEKDGRRFHNELFCVFVIREIKSDDVIG